MIGYVCNGVGMIVGKDVRAPLYAWVLVVPLLPSLDGQCARFCALQIVAHWHHEKVVLTAVSASCWVLWGPTSTRVRFATHMNIVNLAP
jgi:hypothetical protein